MSSLPESMNGVTEEREPRMIITDLDGTLFQTTGAISAADLSTLEELGRRQILRVIATGRSVYSARLVLSEAFPIDYLIFSSGAGIMDWRTQHLLVAHHLTSAEITVAIDLLLQYDVDFMVHRPIPDNHYFAYHATGRENPDFVRRYQRYQAFAAPLDLTAPALSQACQFVAIDPQQDAQSKYALIRRALPMLNVIRSTSPLDGASTWIEIFPAAVSKALAGEWLAHHHAIRRDAILALGNDYNDLDLLQWAGVSVVVRNAPPDLRQTYRTVGSNNEDGFTEAVESWMTS